MAAQGRFAGGSPLVAIAALIAGEPEEAMNFTGGATEKVPSSAIGQLVLGEAQFQLGNLDGAAHQWNTPHVAQWFVDAGFQSLQADQTGEAREAFARALTANSKNETAWQGLIDSLARSGLLDEALTVAIAAIEQLPDSSLLWAKYGRVATDLGDISAGRSAYVRAIELNQHNWQALNQLGGIRLNIDSDPEGARALFAQALERAPMASDPHVGIAETYLAEHNWNAAATSAARAVQLDPTNRWALERLAQAKFALGSYAEARSLAERALGLDQSLSTARDLLQKLDSITSSQ